MGARSAKPSRGLPGGIVFGPAKSALGGAMSDHSWWGIDGNPREGLGDLLPTKEVAAGPGGVTMSNLPGQTMPGGQGSASLAQGRVPGGRGLISEASSPMSAGQGSFLVLLDELLAVPYQTPAPAGGGSTSLLGGLEAGHELGQTMGVGLACKRRKIVMNMPYSTDTWQSAVGSIRRETVLTEKPSHGPVAPTLQGGVSMASASLTDKIVVPGDTQSKRRGRSPDRVKSPEERGLALVQESPTFFKIFTATIHARRKISSSDLEDAELR